MDLKYELRLYNNALCAYNSSPLSPIANLQSERKHRYFQVLIFFVSYLMSWYSFEFNMLLKSASRVERGIHLTCFE
jgi:hypothetical protein